MRESYSVEVVVLKNDRGFFAPESGQIAPGLEDYIDWEDEADDETVHTQLKKIAIQNEIFL